MTDFQAHAKHSGNEFEDFVEQELMSIGKVLEKDFLVEGSGCEADFVAKIKRRKEYIECKGGNGRLRGAQRTDNVKKAIANGTLIKLTDPKIYYVVYFSGRPNPGSYSEQMINTALKHKIIDEVRYREDYDG
jgi:predicted AAA+ superfamily ATPase